MSTSNVNRMRVNRKKRRGGKKVDAGGKSCSSKLTDCHDSEYYCL